MKKHFLSLCLALGALAACQPNTDNNKTLDFDSLQVNFAASLNGQTWPEGAQVGVIATCTRDGQENYLLSENPVARCAVSQNGDVLTPVSEGDKSIALATDHNFRFYGIYPCPSGSVDLSKIPVSVPAVQSNSDAITDRLTFLSSARALTILPTVDLSMNTIFSVLEINIPDDLREGFDSTIKSLEMEPAEGSSFDGFLAPAGTYNAADGVFTVDKSKSSKTVKLDFGPNGLPLTAAFTKVYLVISSMTIPQGGFSIKFTDVDGTVTTVPALASEKEAGTKIAAGQTYTTFVSGISDGIIPVTFPVVFPLGYPNGDTSQPGYCDASKPYLAEWVNDVACVSATRTREPWVGQHGCVHCMDQEQAFVTYTWGEEIQKTTFKKYFIETANTKASGGKNVCISTFGVKGVWTGDFFEFTIPVRKFKANSTLTLTMPFYTRSGPTFWEVLYKDGDEWKTTAVENLPAFEGSDVKRTATWALPFGGAVASTTLDTDQVVSMKFSNEIKSGIINIRVKCVDGSIVSDAANHVKEVAAPAANPFYFWNPNPDKIANGQAITIDLK